MRFQNSHVLISEIILKNCATLQWSFTTTSDYTIYVCITTSLEACPNNHKTLSVLHLGLLNKSEQDLILIFSHQYNELKELYCLIVCLHSHVIAERIFGSSTTAFPGLFPLKFKGKTLGTRLGAQKLRIFTASELLRFCVRLNCCVNILKGINENGDYAISCSTTKCTFGVLHKIVLPKKEWFWDVDQRAVRNHNQCMNEMNRDRHKARQ